VALGDRRRAAEVVRAQVAEVRSGQRDGWVRWGMEKKRTVERKPRRRRVPEGEAFEGRQVGKRTSQLSAGDQPTSG
jgi:hypothetical protein